MLCSVHGGLLELMMVVLFGYKFSVIATTLFSKIFPPSIELESSPIERLGFLNFCDEIKISLLKPEKLNLLISSSIVHLLSSS